MPSSYDILKLDTVQICICLFFGVVLGIVITKIPKTRIGHKFGLFLDKHNSTMATVWESVMQNDNGAWAKVFLRNGMVYLGQLINYTTDPDEPVQEIALYAFSMYIRNEKDFDVDDLKTFLIAIEDANSTNKMEKVLLKRDDIVSIQIYPGQNKELKERAMELLGNILYEEKQKYIRIPANWQEEASVLHYKPQSTNEKWIEDRLRGWKYEKRKDSKNNKSYIIKVNKGRFIPSRVLANIACINGDLLIAAYAKERLFRYNSANKIIKEISQRIPKKERLME